MASPPEEKHERFSPVPEGPRPTKVVSIIISKLSDDGLDLKTVTSKDLRKLQATAPFHLEGHGLLVNDMDMGDDISPAWLHTELPSARAPSDDLLVAPHGSRQTRTESSKSKYPLGINSGLTLDQLKTNLKNIRREGNGYNLNFTVLDLSDQNLVDISPLGRFSSLTSVNISGNYIQNVEVFGCMPYLKVINACRNDMEVFGDFRAPIALQQINFSRNRIKRLINMETFWALTEVNLSHNQLENAEGFENCKHLRVLDLSHNRLSGIENLDCPALVALFLHNNMINGISNFESCPNLRALSLAQNHIESLEPLRNIAQLNELWLQGNRIRDMSELEHLKPLLNLSSLFLHPNEVTNVGMWRAIAIYTLSQVRILDGKLVDPAESVQAKNTFNPSPEKVAYENKMAVLLDRACQAAGIILDDGVYRSVLPPVLLLVGAPMSHCYRLSMLIKQKFRTRVQLGGVHSTATTLEFSNTSKDIPVSFESFSGMKQSGEFLASSYILGRICGFATSQITRAYERSAILVASVPLGVALTLRSWNLKSKNVLVMPTGKMTGLSTTSDKLLASSVLESAVPTTEDLAERFDENPGGVEDTKHGRAPSISFARASTTYNLDAKGDKKPSLDRAEGPGVLRNKFTDEIPDLPVMFSSMYDTLSNEIGTNEFSSEPPPGRSKSVVSVGNYKSPPPTKNDGRDGESVGAVARQTVSDTTAVAKQRSFHSSKQLQQIFSAASKLQNSDDTDPDAARSDNATTTDSSTPPPFTTDGPVESARFSTTLNKMTKLRRIASLFFEVGGSPNVAEFFRDLPPDSDLNYLFLNLNWNEALLDLDPPQAPSNDNAYYMLFNKCPFNQEQLAELCGNNVRLLKNLRKCHARARRGAYELLFLKTSLLNEMATVSAGPLEANMEEMTSNAVEGRIFGNYQLNPQVRLANESSIQPDAVTQAKPSEKQLERIPSKLMGLRSKISSAENPATAATGRSVISSHGFQEEPCRAVINPNYAFGPHEVDCRNRLEHSNLKLRVPNCSTYFESERGTFFDGKFQSNFLDSVTASGSFSELSGCEQTESVLELKESVTAHKGVSRENYEELLGSTRIKSAESVASGKSTCLTHPPSLPTRENSVVEFYDDEETNEEATGYEVEFEGESRGFAPPPSRDNDSIQANSRAQESKSSRPLKSQSRAGLNEDTRSVKSQSHCVLNDDTRSLKSQSRGGVNEDIESISHSEFNISITDSVCSLNTNEAQAALRRKIRQRAENCIMNAREDYIKFHQENPGYFSLVIDSEDLDSCMETLSGVIEELITQFQNQRESRVASYGGRATTDYTCFVNHRLQEFKELSTGFAKGLPQPAPLFTPSHRPSRCDPVTRAQDPPLRLNFERSKCPPNLLEPRIDRRPRNMKIKRIIQH